MMNTIKKETKTFKLNLFEYSFSFIKNNTMRKAVNMSEKPVLKKEKRTKRNIA